MSTVIDRLQRIRDQKGMALVEALVTVAVLGTTVLAFTVALATGALGVSENKQEAVVQSLARSQMEYTKSYAYDPAATTYPTVAAPPGYAISVGVSSISGTDSNIQRVSANITRDGTLVKTITDYKVNR